MGKNEMKIFSCNSNRTLAEDIARRLGMNLASSEVTKFKDEEIAVRLNESVRGVDVFIVQSTCKPANNNLMELILMVDAAKRASARSITAVMPYFGYARQDRKVEPRVPISAKVVANLIQASGISRLLTMDLHADQIQGFFDVPVDNLFASPLVIDYIKSMNISDMTIVSPDSGGVDRARFIAKRLDAGLAIIDKRRPKANVCEVMNVIGEVSGRNCVMIDDIVDTGGSISGGAKALKEFGAKDVYCIATHPVLSGNAFDNLGKAGFREIIFSDTIPVDESKRLDNMTILPTAPLFAEAIKRIFNGESVSSLFI
ncbi:MAG TPA: ribose-phosphate pyrophosphokinase [Spirochaetota bacterium]|jgi:ribose-phosphate pyrophosphokinase|nr:ribose-phosphate pyrophosphokinase [Spirochaetota bacterium]HPW52434.1 ribose-phosphate pyrophosphokinase [Spirochaetota bacterium]